MSTVYITPTPKGAALLNQVYAITENDSFHEHLRRAFVTYCWSLEQFTKGAHFFLVPTEIRKQEDIQKFDMGRYLRRESRELGFIVTNEPTSPTSIDVRFNGIEPIVDSMRQRVGFKDLDMLVTASFDLYTDLVVAFRVEHKGIAKLLENQVYMVGSALPIAQ